MVATNFNPISDFILAVGFLATVITVSRNKIPRQTVKDLQELTSSQAKSIEELKQGRIEDAKAIARLEGQVALYKELPLRELAEGIKQVVSISQANADSNQRILETLQTTAKINAEDRDVLTNQNLHIKTEVLKEMSKP